MNARQKCKKLKKKIEQLENQKIQIKETKWPFPIVTLTNRKMYSIDQLDSLSVHPELLEFELKREVLDEVSNYICIRKCEDEYPGAYTYEAYLAVADMRGTGAACTRELEIPTKHNGLDAY